jgi:hypothetical protein
MCAKYVALDFYQRVLLGRASTPFKTGAREDLRGLCGCPSRVETKGFLRTRATEHALAFVYKRSFISGI